MSYISIRGLSKYYGKQKALNNINLEIPKGRIVGLLGKNGAGKSTLMRSILGFLKYEGQIKILGEDIAHNAMVTKKDIAFIPDVSCLDDRLTVGQTIDYVKNVNFNWDEATAERLLKKSDLPLNKKVSALSKGMKTKLYLLITLALDVKILLLDEPTLGLDILFRKEFFNTILGEFYNSEKTIIISTHQVEEVEHILQDIIFIDYGNLILYENVQNLKDKYNIISVPCSQKNALLAYQPQMMHEALGKVHAIVKSEVQIEGAEYNRPGLSDLFVAKVGGLHE
ncbi:MAG TPA: multidrug ABC transporter ATP-binding protein [Candidatus Cloacimonas sp.]|jgi:ABC-2 type transport system ATP-binding protein|nr:type transport system ATP-binding protein [Candidatus Cloacimonadota bacterium]HCX72699.1 multidrug ABC transporter ATP-binding protein [Candidatus Cloacimonas sp.]